MSHLSLLIVLMMTMVDGDHENDDEDDNDDDDEDDECTCPREGGSAAECESRDHKHGLLSLLPSRERPALKKSS